MARGWESKSVEAQIEEGKQREEQAPAPTSPEGRAREQRLESLRLSRSRLLDQLDRATLPAHREVLQNGLRAIEKELDELAES